MNGKHLINFLKTAVEGKTHAVILLDFLPMSQSKMKNICYQ